MTQVLIDREVVERLLPKIDAAIKRITSGQAPMRIPAEPDEDPDLVLASCRAALRASLDSAPEGEPQPNSDHVGSSTGTRPNAATLDSDQAICVLRAALDDADVRGLHRFNTIGFFCNHWNAALAAPQPQPVPEPGALHASAPEGWKCADCAMDREACPTCYAAWWQARHPNSLQDGGERRLWLWKNFVDGRPEYWAFDNPYPTRMDCGDPQTLGEPCGYVIVKESRRGRTDVSDEKVIESIKRVWSKDFAPQPESPSGNLAVDSVGAMEGLEGLAEWLRSLLDDGMFIVAMDDVALSGNLVRWINAVEALAAPSVGSQQGEAASPSVQEVHDEVMGLADAYRVAEIGFDNIQEPRAALSIRLRALLSQVPAQPSGQPGSQP